MADQKPKRGRQSKSWLMWETPLPNWLIIILLINALMALVNLVGSVL